MKPYEEPFALTSSLKPAQSGAAWRFFARHLSFSGDVLVTLDEAVGRAGCVAGSLAGVVGCTGRRSPAEVGRDVPRRQLRSGEKGAPPFGINKRGKARSGWCWPTVAVFDCEFDWKVSLREKLRLPKSRSLASKSV